MPRTQLRTLECYVVGHILLRNPVQGKYAEALRARNQINEFVRKPACIVAEWPNWKAPVGRAAIPRFVQLHSEKIEKRSQKKFALRAK